MIQDWKPARAWWQGLQPDPDRGQKGDRASLARLRRCATVSEAMTEPATLQLFRRVGATRPEDLPNVALTAAVLAHVRHDMPGTVARAVGPVKLEQPETARLKPLRFRRLMEADEPNERLTAFRRLVALAEKDTLPVSDLAASLLDWTEWRRRRWIYDYWNAGQSAAAAAVPLTPTPLEDHAG